MKQKNLPPAQLWLGSHDTLTAEAITCLQKHFCSDDGCGVCAPCKQVREQQHHAVMWLYPEKQYTLEAVKPIHERLAFALDEEQNYFFIIQKADFLTTQSANSLLKSIEEPPTGYHFILCAERSEYILPTIKSRCVVHTFDNETIIDQHQDLYHYFTQTTPTDPLSFANHQ